MRRLVHRFSLRTRLLLITAGLLLAGLGIIGTVVSGHLERYQLDRLDDQLRTMTSIIATVPVAGAPDPERTADAALLDPALDIFGNPYLVYLDLDGTPYGDVHSSQLDPASLPSLDDFRSVAPDGAATGLRAADGSARWRVVAQSAIGWDGTVIAAAPRTDIDAVVAQIRTSSLISGLVLLVTLTALGWFALGRGLRPLRRVETTAAAIAEGDLTQRVPDLAVAGTEIGRLARSLNAMLGQLERAFADRTASEARMRTFVADVSHELRTPLFGITGTADLYRMGALPERADVDEAITSIRREATRLTALTEDLLLLAQLDEAPDGQLDRTPMDLRTLAGDARNTLRALDPTRRIELTGPGGNGPPGPAPVHADEARLRQVTTNLVGNAAAHTPSGSPVRLGVGMIDGLAILEVADEGPGMSAIQADRVFDRFYRADRSRKRSDGATAGLGLAIARSLARAHGGDIELRTALGEGARLRLTLPTLNQGPHSE